MSLERKEIPSQFLERIRQIRQSKVTVSLDNGCEVLLSPRHATVLRLLQTAKGPVPKEDLRPYLKFVTSGIWKLNIGLRGSGHKVKNIAPKGKASEPQYILIETKDDQVKSKERKKAKTKNSPESIEMAKKELAINLSLVVLSHLANNLMEELTDDSTKLLKGAHSNKQVTLVSITNDDPKRFLADSLRELERFYDIDPQDKSLSAKEKQTAEFFNQLKNNGWQIQDMIDAVFTHFDLPRRQ